MNIYIMADIEGISGIYSPEQIDPEGNRFQEGRRYMTDEVNVCIRACKDAGADHIYVRDAHGGSYTLIWEELSEDATYCICGVTESCRMPGLDDCDALILLGYHAMAGTQSGTLEHSMSSRRIQNYWINGVKSGEIAIDAAIAAEHGKPVILVSGDDVVCREAREFLPWVKTAEVKKGMSSFGAMLLPRKKSHETIYRETFRAVKEAAGAGLYRVSAPVCLRVETTERTPVPMSVGKPYYRRLDGRTYEVTAPTAEEAFFLS